MLKTLADIFTAPSSAFADIREKPRVLLPLLLFLAATVSLQFGYFLLADFDYIIEDLVAQAAGSFGVPEDALRQQYANTSPRAMAISSAVSVSIIIPLIIAIYAGYLTLISKFTYDEINYKRWYSLTVWTSMPSLLAVLAGWVVLLTSPDGMIGQNDIRPLSLNNLIFRSDGALAPLLDQFDVTQVWALVLLILGYRQWTGKGPVFSTLIVTMPYFVIIGTVALILL